MHSGLGSSNFAHEVPQVLIASDVADQGFRMNLSLTFCVAAYRIAHPSGNGTKLEIGIAGALTVLKRTSLVR
jgi:hypothetical protein